MLKFIHVSFWTNFGIFFFHSSAVISGSLLYIDMKRIFLENYLFSSSLDVHVFQLSDALITFLLVIEPDMNL